MASKLMTELTDSIVFPWSRLDIKIYRCYHVALSMFVRWLGAYQCKIS